MDEKRKLLSFALILLLVSCLGTATWAAEGVTLTPQERAWVEKHPEITLAGGVSFEPYLMHDDDGKVIGHDADIANLIAKRTGLKIRIELGKWSEMQERAKKREFDGLCTASLTEARKSHYNASRPYIHLTNLVIVKRGNPKNIRVSSDFSGKRVALQRGNALKDILEKEGKGFEIIYFDSMHDVIKAVASGRADFTLLEESAFYIANQLGLGNMIEAPFTVGEGMDVHFLLRNDWPLLKSIIDKGLKAITTTEKRETRDRWFGRSRSDENRIPLTPQEQTWIKKHPEIRLGVAQDWHPMEYVDKKGQYRGISSDYVRILNERLGLNMKIVPNLNWRQVMDAVPQRGVDVLPGVARTPEREKHLLYSAPYLHIDWVIISRSDRPAISSLADLEGRLTSVDDGWASHERIKQQYPGIPLLPGKTTVDVLRSVLDGKAEAAIVEMNAATLIMHGYRMQSLKIDGHIFQDDDPISFAVRNDWPELVSILNKGLASIGTDDRERIKQKWLAVPIYIGRTNKEVARIVLLVVAALGTILLLSLFWNRRLKKEVVGRIEAEKGREKKQEALLASEERLRLLIDNTGDMISRHSADSTITYVSPSCEKLLGYRPEELLHRRSAELVHPEDVDNVLAVLDDAAARHDANYRSECRVECRDGHYVWTETVGKLLYGDEGELQEIQCSVRGISDRKHAEGAILKSEKNYRLLVENANSIILRWNGNGHITYFNEYAESLFGYSRDDVLGKHVVGTIVPETESTGRDMQPLMDDICLHPKKYEYNVNENMCKDGRRIWVAWTNKTYVSEETGEIEALSIGMDITEQRQLEDQLRQSEKMTAIGQLAGGIAHDFNNQLTSVLGYSEMLETHLEDDKLKRYASKIKKGAKRSAELTAQLLAFSRKGKNLSVLVNIHKVLAEVIGILEHTIDKRITIRQSLNATPATTVGDPNQLHNAILNIALNARDAMPEGGELIFETTIVELDKDFCKESQYEVLPGSYLTIGVTDTGCGMDAETQKYIFEPFYTNKGVGKGTGMGLASVYGTICNHNGAVSVKSDVGHGTNFEIYLPLSQDARSEPEDNGHSKPITGSARILLVDDEEVIREVATDMLNALGYKITVCKNGKEAVEHYEASWKEIDLVLLDMVMPELGGRDTFAAMKKVNPDVRAILSSGYSIDGEAQSILDDGVMAFVGKPFEQAELSETVAQVLSGADE